MHTDATLNVLDSLTTKIGVAFHNFTDVVCPKFATNELPRERQAQKRKEAKRSSGRLGDVQVVNNTSNGSSAYLAQPHMLHEGLAQLESMGPTSSSSLAGPKGTRNPEQTPEFKGKTYNMNTYKHHSLGDYVKHIREYGTTDS